MPEQKKTGILSSNVKNQLKHVKNQLKLEDCSKEVCFSLQN